MRTHLAFAAALIFVLASSSPAADEAVGFVSLFDGKTLDGWTFLGKQYDKRWNMWKVDEGTLLADSSNARDHDDVYLATTKEYGDFVLRLKFQAFRETNGTIGVQFRSRYEPDAYWADGPEVIVDPGRPWRSGMIHDQTRGSKRWLCPDLPSGRDVDLTQANERHKFYYNDQNTNWNELEVSAIGSKVRVVLNGVTVSEFDGKGVLDDKVHQDRNVGQKGIITLHLHAGDRLRMRYKDIDIKDLAAQK